MKLLLIDNYDSFTYNLVHLFAAHKDTIVDVCRNDQNFMSQLKSNNYDGVIISPGPGNPNDKAYFGNNMKVIEQFGMNGMPILGVCLGFQGIASFFGAKLKQARLPQHGKTSKLVLRDESELFAKIPDGIDVMRYHSLMIDDSYPIASELKITAEVVPESRTVKVNGREIMALEHISLPIYGVQFHPESFASEMGGQIAKNYIDIVKRHKDDN